MSKAVADARARAAERREFVAELPQRLSTDELRNLWPTCVSRPRPPTRASRSAARRPGASSARAAGQAGHRAARVLHRGARRPRRRLRRRRPRRRREGPRRCHAPDPLDRREGRPAPRRRPRPRRPRTDGEDVSKPSPPRAPTPPRPHRGRRRGRARDPQRHPSNREPDRAQDRAEGLREFAAQARHPPRPPQRHVRQLSRTQYTAPLMPSAHRGCGSCSEVCSQVRGCAAAGLARTLGACSSSKTSTRSCSS